MVGALIAFLCAVVIAQAALLVRAGRRLFQFDDIFQGIIPVLDAYSSDLQRMVSADLDGILVDHPEVLAFHKRNMAAKLAVESIVGSVTSVTPRRPRAPALPRPDVE